MAEKFHRLLLRLPPFLDQRLAEKQYTTYKILAQGMGGYANRSIYVADALGVLLREDHEQGNPHRAASVVRGLNSEGAHFPGSGYFWVCRDLGLVNDLDDHTALIEFWAKQAERLGLPPPTAAQKWEFAIHELRTWKLGFKNLEDAWRKHHGVSLKTAPLFTDEVRV